MASAFTASSPAAVGAGGRGKGRGASTATAGLRLTEDATAAFILAARLAATKADERRERITLTGGSGGGGAMLLMWPVAPLVEGLVHATVLSPSFAGTTSAAPATGDLLTPISL